MQVTSPAEAQPPVEQPKKAKRKRITPEQLEHLVALFEKTDTPSYETREGLAKKLGMTNREIQVWFQNRRAKANRIKINEQAALQHQQHLQQQLQRAGYAAAAAPHIHSAPATPIQPLPHGASHSPHDPMAYGGYLPPSSSAPHHHHAVNHPMPTPVPRRPSATARHAAQRRPASLYNLGSHHHMQQYQQQHLQHQQAYAHATYQSHGMDIILPAGSTRPFAGGPPAPLTIPSSMHVPRSPPLGRDDAAMDYERPRHERTPSGSGHGVPYGSSHSISPTSPLARLPSNGSHPFDHERSVGSSTPSSPHYGGTANGHHHHHHPPPGHDHPSPYSNVQRPSSPRYSPSADMYDMSLSGHRTPVGGAGQRPSMGAFPPPSNDDMDRDMDISPRERSAAGAVDPRRASSQDRSYYNPAIRRSGDLTVIYDEHHELMQDDLQMESRLVISDDEPKGSAIDILAYAAACVQETEQNKTKREHRDSGHYQRDSSAAEESPQSPMDVSMDHDGKDPVVVERRKTTPGASGTLMASPELDAASPSAWTSSPGDRRSANFSLMQGAHVFADPSYATSPVRRARPVTYSGSGYLYDHHEDTHLALPATYTTRASPSPRRQAYRNSADISSSQFMSQRAWSRARRSSATAYPPSPKSSGAGAAAAAGGDYRDGRGGGYSNGGAPSESDSPSSLNDDGDEEDEETEMNRLRAAKRRSGNANSFFACSPNGDPLGFGGMRSTNEPMFPPVPSLPATLASTPTAHGSTMTTTPTASSSVGSSRPSSQVFGDDSDGRAAGAMTTNSSSQGPVGSPETRQDVSSTSSAASGHEGKQLPPIIDHPIKKEEMDHPMSPMAPLKLDKALPPINIAPPPGKEPEKKKKSWRPWL
ncbi:hypothetical protein BGZ73_004408 [Actinomortierella ambigua]|nr:hypothetical protein BGZ73_004408 [Actinomortierella ambigua]